MDDKTAQSAVSTTAKKSPPAAKAREWHPFETLRREVDSLFEDFARRPLFGRGALNSDPLLRWEWPSVSVPATEVAESEQGYEVTVELPGMDESNIQVEVSNGVLVISGEKKEEKEEKKKRFYLSERHYGSFERSFRLPDGVDASKIEASFKKGVLTVALPKSPEAQQSEKKIPIKTD